MNTCPTADVDDLLAGCDSLEELKEEILPLLVDQRRLWQARLAQILTETGYSCRQLAQLCRVSETAVRKWCRGSLPQSRDMYIRIGFAAGYDLERMNAFLTRYGRCPQLYARSLEDSVCIFVLNSRTLPHTYESFLQVLGAVKAQLTAEAANPGAVYSTQQLCGGILDLASPLELAAFVRENADAYRQKYARLYAYVIAFLRENLTIRQSGAGDRRISFHEMAEEGRWSSSLRHCVSQIRNRQWFPRRDKIISLGLHLNMETSAINYMLSCAQMPPLCTANPVEAAVVWAINEAVLRSENACIDPDGSPDLCRFVRNVLTQLELSESEYLIEDL